MDCGVNFAMEINDKEKQDSGCPLRVPSFSIRIDKR